MTISRFRHLQPQLCKPCDRLLDVRPTNAISDGSNVIACNEEYVAIPWSQTGSTAVFPHGSSGKVRPTVPLFIAPTDSIVDLKFHPFCSSKMFTASEDGLITGWDIPAAELEETCSAYTVQLSGHSKRCSMISFHPSASNVLASAGADKLVLLWDVERSHPVTTFNFFTEPVLGLDWNLDGSQLCAVSRDRKLSIADSRSGKMVGGSPALSGGKMQRCIWAKQKNVILSFGCNARQRRQIMVWDSRKMAEACCVADVDHSGSGMMPYFDEDTNLLFACTKGEGGIKSFELLEGSLLFASEFNTHEPLKGMCTFPKWLLNVKECEVARIYQLTQTSLYTVKMVLPRRHSESVFQEDVYVPTFAPKAAISSADFFSGIRSAPLMCDLSPLFHGTGTPLIDESDVAKQSSAVPNATSTRNESGATTSYLEGSNSCMTESDEQEPQGASEISRKGSMSRAKHADPDAIDFSASIDHNRLSSVKQLCEKLLMQQNELRKLRALLREKEEEMAKTLDDLDKASR